jgi:hypothetical protein
VKKVVLNLIYNFQSFGSKQRVLVYIDNVFRCSNNLVFICW